MESKKIRELAVVMQETGLTVLDYKGNDGIAIRLERASTQLPERRIQAVAPQVQEERHEEQPTNAGFTVRSPMVGVFYSSPGADKKPYVEVGDTVHAGDILCIIEAMKTMNEITAERDGKVLEVCAENRQVVEFNQPLFRIDTD